MSLFPFEGRPSCTPSYPCIFFKLVAMPPVVTIAHLCGSDKSATIIHLIQGGTELAAARDPACSQDKARRARKARKVTYHGIWFVDTFSWVAHIGVAVMSTMVMGWHIMSWTARCGQKAGLPLSPHLRRVWPVGVRATTWCSGSNRADLFGPLTGDASGLFLEPCGLDSHKYP
jgi:hypothetical protein